MNGAPFYVLDFGAGLRFDFNEIIAIYCNKIDFYCLFPYFAV